MIELKDVTKEYSKGNLCAKWYQPEDRAGRIRIYRR